MAKSHRPTTPIRTISRSLSLHITPSRFLLSCALLECLNRDISPQIFIISPHLILRKFSLCLEQPELRLIQPLRTPLQRRASAFVVDDFQVSRSDVASDQIYSKVWLPNLAKLLLITVKRICTQACTKSTELQRYQRRPHKF